MHHETNALVTAFQAHVLKDVNCYYWSGPQDEHGQPVLHHNGQQILAAHVAFWIDTGHWSSGQPLHLCADVDCVAAHHLWFHGFELM